MEPTTGLIAAFHKIVESKSANRIMFMLLVVSSILLCRPRILIANPNMAAFIDDYWAGIVLGFIASCAFFVFDVGAWLRRRQERVWDEQSVTRPGNNLEKLFITLTDNERAILGEFIHRERRSFNFPASYPEIWTLFKRRLILPDHPLFYPVHITYGFTISDDVWDYLHEEKRRDPVSFDRRFPRLPPFDPSQDVPSQGWFPP